MCKRGISSWNTIFFFNGKVRAVSHKSQSHSSHSSQTIYYLRYLLALRCKAEMNETKGKQFSFPHMHV